MSGNKAITIGRALPRIREVAALPPSSLEVTWESGEREGLVEVIDIAPMLYDLKLFRPLRDNESLFRTAHVTAFGSAVAWGDDERIDISSVALEDLAESAMTANDFKEFLKRHKLTFEGAAAQLGLSRRLVAYYASGREVPRVVMLACRYLDASRATSDDPAFS